VGAPIVIAAAVVLAASSFCHICRIVPFVCIADLLTTDF
jgi:hypothetical protein